MGFRSWITEPELLGLDVEAPERIKLHLDILARKKMLQGVFEEFYRTCMDLDRRYFGDTPGQRVELGAGVSMFKKFFPEVIISDIKPADHLDMVVDAQEMPFKAGSIRTLFGLSFFHHLPDPEKFFHEMMRTINPGGGCILLDPYYGPVASRFYKYLHATETYNKNEPDWSSTDRGAMMNANQALTYIVFWRDRERFAQLFPDLEIVYAKPVPNYLRYLCSGGLNFRPLLPDFCIGPLKLLERLLIPLLPLTALYHIIVVRKRRGAPPAP